MIQDKEGFDIRLTPMEESGYRAFNFASSMYNSYIIYSIMSKIDSIDSDIKKDDITGAMILSFSGSSMEA